MEFSAWIALVYLTSNLNSGKWKSLSDQEKFSCNTNFLTYFSQKLSFLVFLSNSFCNNDNIVSFVTANVSYNVFMLWRRDMVGRKLVMCMHGMHHPHSSKIEGVKNFLKKSGGEDQTILILEVGSVMVGVNFSRGGSENFWSKWKKNKNITVLKITILICFKGVNMQ